MPRLTLRIVKYRYKHVIDAHVSAFLTDHGWIYNNWCRGSILLLGLHYCLSVPFLCSNNETNSRI
jgi:hypothetical protein